jgi:tetratricopeptide (TPR) repeat protein
MPAHIFARVGRWKDASQSNRDAIRADAAFRAANPHPGFYALYMAHNHHFLSFSAMMQGQSDESIRVAREMVAGVSEEFLRDYGPIADGYMAFVPEALMRFGKWNEILQEPEPRESLPLARTLWRFCRAIAFTALGRVEEAKSERQEFLNAAKKVSKDATFGNNSAELIIRIATSVLEGEMAAQRGELKQAAAHLRRAARYEDTLRYDEPPDWMLPVRHTLGAVLLKAGKNAEAETTYREDLVRFPDNGWSLFGLARALELQGKTEQAALVRRRFETIWAAADVRLDSSCFCQQVAGTEGPLTIN